MESFDLKVPKVEYSKSRGMTVLCKCPMFCSNRLDCSSIEAFICQLNFTNLWMNSLRSKRFRAVSRVKDRAIKTARKMARISSRFTSRAAKTENLVPRSFFTPKQHGKACYAG